MEFIIDQALICDLRRLMRKKPRIDHLCEAIPPKLASPLQTENDADTAHDLPKLFFVVRFR
jgi:hypothetical protein